MLEDWYIHHERLDGSGYPYHLKKQELHPESVILTIADIFTALVETRSYRKGLTKEETFKVMNYYQKNKALDAEIIDLVKDNYHNLSNVILDSYSEVFREYAIFDEQINQLKS